MPFSRRAPAPGPLCHAAAFVALASAASAADLTLRAPDALRDAVLSASLTQSALDDGTTNAQDLIAAAQADYRRVLAALYEQGYFSAEVHIRVDGREASTLSALQPPASVGTVEIAVTPGAAFTFGRAEVTPLPDDATPTEGFGPGQPAGTTVMRAAANDGVEAWRQSGHAKAAVTDQSILVDHAVNRVDAGFRIAPGPRLSFGRARIADTSADSTVRPERIRAIAGVPEGEIYDPDEIERAERRLRRTGAFRAANITEDEAIGPNNTLGTEIEVEDAKPRRFGVGAEISTIEGLRLSGFWLHRNAFGGAERLRFDAEIAGIGGQTGGIDYSLGATLTRPAFRHPDAQLTLRAMIAREDEPSYLSDNVELGLGVDRILTDKLTVRGELAFRLARTTDGYGRREFQHALFTGGATWDDRDDSTDARKGTYAEVELMPFLGLSGSASGLRAKGDFRAYQPLGDRLVLAGRAQIGSVMGPSIAATPPEFLFFSGGGGTVRGQGYQSLGVTSGGTFTGGRSFAALSGELRGDVTDKIGAVAFVDYGYVAASSQFSGGNWHGGAGIGVRYKTGIGPVRADIATPITGAGTGRSISLYVGIGQAF